MKNTQLFNFGKYFFAILLSASVLFLASCGDDDEETTDPAPTTPTVDKTITELAVESDGLDSLERQLTKFDDLVALLSDTTVSYTVFAPNDQAFANLLTTPGFPPTFDQISDDIIKGVLSYHVVVGQKIMSTDLGPDMSTAYTDPASGEVQVIKVNSDGTLLTGSTNQAIQVLTADIEAKNGVIHIVESVMIPPSVGATLTPILGTNAGTVLLSADFTQLAGIVALADSDPNVSPKVAEVLADPDNDYTVFGPPNAVLDNVDLSGFDAASARALLLNHVIAGQEILSANIQGGEELTTMGGRTLKVAVSGSSILVGLDTATIPVVNPDIISDNGVVHAIGGVLQ